MDRLFWIVIHTASLVELSTNLTVVIEVVDDEVHVDRLVPILDEMITGGPLVTVERVRVLRCDTRLVRRGRPPHRPPSDSPADELRAGETLGADRASSVT